VRIHHSESRAFGDRRDPPVRGPPIESLPVCTAQDRPFVSFTNREIDRARSTGDQRDDGRFVALPDDAQGAVSTLECEGFDVRRAGLADT